MTGDLFQGGLLEAPLYPLKPGVSRGPPGLSGGPGPLRPPCNSTTASDPCLYCNSHFSQYHYRILLVPTATALDCRTYLHCI